MNSRAIQNSQPASFSGQRTTGGHGERRSHGQQQRKYRFAPVGGQQFSF